MTGLAGLIPRPVLFGKSRAPPAAPVSGRARLAWITPHQDVLNVWVAAADHGVVTVDTDGGIRFFGWAHDGRHLIYLQDVGGDENWRLHDVDLETMGRRDLTPFGGVCRPAPPGCRAGRARR